MGRTPKLRHLILVVALLLTAAACGDDDDATAGGEDSESAVDTESAGAVETSGEDSDSAAGGGDPCASLVSDAESDGGLVWYNSYAPVPSEALMAAFTERYDIPVEYIRLTTGPLTQRFAAESGAGSHTADVMTISGGVFFEEALQQGWITTLDETDVPTLADWPDEGWNLDAVATVSINPIYTAWNTDRVASDEVPESWEDLLEPRFSGDLMIPDIRAVPSWLAQTHMLANELGDDFLRGLADQDFDLVESVVPGSQALAAGENAVLIFVNEGVIGPLKEEGAPVDYKLLDPTSGLEIHSVVSANAPSPGAARLFQCFMLTPDGQEALNAGSGASLLPDIPGATQLPDGYIPPEYAEAAAEQDGLTNLLGIGG